MRTQYIYIVYTQSAHAWMDGRTNGYSSIHAIRTVHTPYTYTV